MIFATNSLERQSRNQSYWKCHGKKHTENTEKITSVFSVHDSVAKNLCFFEKDLTVSSTKATKRIGIYFVPMQILCTSLPRRNGASF